MDPTSIPEPSEWTQAASDTTDYLDYLAQNVSLGAWAAFARVFMPRFVEVEGCVLWDRVYDPGNFRDWHERLQGDSRAIEATLNQFRLWLYVDIPEDAASEAGAAALAEQICVSWRHCLREAFPDRTFEVTASNSEDGPVVRFVTAR
ncbi:hypothetical protein [Streptomyces sp. TS71-3]|uniref:hypothetical protein n=1 Tax=Streptomyces sp. TS71-3 TaxID=2733862 RepID=UPI001B19E918|nr:hypothetical protein [Streptomyces sp. TS71-3]GHJ40489.1 hypothetical protein Sm713_60980 [Streptomyces sp. TS71-3]